MDLKYLAPVLKPDFAFTVEELQTEIPRAMEGASELYEAIQGRRSASSQQTAPGLNVDYIARIAPVIYEYAVFGCWPATDTNISFSDKMQDLSAFAKSARAAAEMYGTEVPLRSEQCLAMAACRAKLDAAIFGESPAEAFESPGRTLTLLEVAVLAQMNEKSVRNATQARSNDPLKTVKVGPRTAVEPEEALRWLKNRRNFHPTTHPSAAGQ